MGKNNQKRQPSPETPVVEEEEEDRSEEEERSDDGDEGAYEGSHEDADEQGCLAICLHLASLASCVRGDLLIDA